jgi:uncharacterized protein DUF3846
MAKKESARWIKADGREVQISPAKSHFALKELQAAVNGYIEFVSLSHTGADQVMVVNEDGKSLNLSMNKTASLIACRPIVGDVLIVPSKLIAR